MKKQRFFNMFKVYLNFQLDSQHTLSEVFVSYCESDASWKIRIGRFKSHRGESQRKRFFFIPRLMKQQLKIITFVLTYSFKKYEN